MDNMNPGYQQPPFPGANTPNDQTNQFDPRDIEQNKVMAILAYFGILVLVPIFAAKESKFARYHANQGLILFIASIVLWIAVSILSYVILAISWKLSFIASLLSLALWVGILVLSIMGIINAANGKAKELPVIGKFQLLK